MYPVAEYCDLNADTIKPDDVLTSKAYAGVIVPIPTLPLPLTNKLPDTVGESILNNPSVSDPEIYSLASRAEV
jgi:hypothetical protein